MAKYLVASAVQVGASHGIKDVLVALTALEGNIEILFVDYSPAPRYAKWLSKEQQIARVGVLREEFAQDVGVYERKAKCHNIIRDEAVRRGCEGVLFFGQDIVLPRDALKRLLKAVGRKKSVACGVSYNLYVVAGSVLQMSSLFAPYNKEQEDHLKSHKADLEAVNPGLYAALVKSGWDFSGVKRQLPPAEVKGEGILPIKSAPFDCCYVPLSVLKDITFKSEGGTKSDEALFFLEMKEKKIPVVADKAVQCSRKLPKDVLDRSVQHAQRQAQTTMQAQPPANAAKKRHGPAKAG